MKAITGLVRFRAVAMLAVTPALLPAQSARSSPRISQTKDAVYVTIDVPGSTLTCATGISPNGNIVGVYTTVADPNPDC